MGRGREGITWVLGKRQQEQRLGDMGWLAVSWELKALLEDKGRDEVEGEEAAGVGVGTPCPGHPGLPPPPSSATDSHEIRVVTLSLSGSPRIVT